MLDATGRPTPDEYFMQIAMAVRRRANCLGNRVGAIAVLDKRIVATGYNGTPSGMKNCLEGGCPRCADRAKYPAGTSYDLCLCVHAEQNVLLAAARFGIPLEGALVYTTMRPCFGCAKEMLQVKVRGVVYLHEWNYPDKAMQEEQQRLLDYFPEGVRRLEIADPDEVWALSALRSRAGGVPDTGHGLPTG